MIKLSIIIPVYNVEKYIHTCVESLFRQGLNENVFEVIIIDDGSPDHSIEAIADLINLHTNMTIVNQENQGLSVARNTGLNYAKGKYILFLDSDDLLYDYSLQRLLEEAISYDVDLAVADFVKIEDQKIQNHKEFKIPQQECKITIKTGKQLIIEDLIPDECYVWRTLYKKDFLETNHINFIPGIKYEDIPFTHECYIKAKTCMRIRWYFYIYRKGQSSISSALSLNKGKEFCQAIGETWKLTLIDGLDPDITQKLKNDVFASFSALIYGATHEIEKMSERKEIITYMKQVAPNMHFNNGIKQRFINLMYHHLPNLYLAIRVLYGKKIEGSIRKWREQIKSTSSTFRLHNSR